MSSCEQKRGYIDTVHPQNTEKFSEWLALFSPYEEAWKMDLVLQSIEPLQEAFNQITRDFTPKQKKDFLALLKSYREWYLAHTNKKAICAGVLLLKNDQTEALRKKMVSSTLHLKMILDEVFETPEKGTLACIYRAYLWLAFIGVPKEKASQITIDDVDFHHMQLHHNGIHYELPTHGLMEFRQLCELDSFVSYHKNPDFEYQKTRIPGNQLLRGTTQNSLNPKTPTLFVRRGFVDTAYSLNYDSVALSGLYCRKFELERAGLPIDFRQEVMANSTANEKSIEMLLYQRKRHYAQWKEAFEVN